MTICRRVNCLYATNHPGQLSLAIPPWVDARSNSESWDINRHTAQFTSPISAVTTRHANWWLADVTEISTALLALWLWKGYICFTVRNNPDALIAASSVWLQLWNFCCFELMFIPSLLYWFR